MVDAAKGQTCALSKPFLVRRRPVDNLQHAMIDAAKTLALRSARLILEKAPLCRRAEDTMQRVTGLNQSMVESLMHHPGQGVPHHAQGPAAVWGELQEAHAAVQRGTRNKRSQTALTGAGLWCSHQPKSRPQCGSHMFANWW